MTLSIIPALSVTSRECLRSEAVDLPAAFFRIQGRKADAVVQARSTTLPELDDVRSECPTAPVRRAGNVFTFEALSARSFAS